jgi:SAM-dependent methyltransferase
MELSKLTNVQATYDSVAEEYARRIYDELSHKPLDRELLDRFAARVKESGMVCDLGCGPGHVAKYLARCGVNVCGLDLSARMVEIARRLNPEIRFNQGDMFHLNVEEGAWAGIAAMYSIIHTSPADLPTVFREMRRVLRPGGWLLLAFHVGTEIIHRDEWWGIPVSIDAYFFDPEEIAGVLAHAGFTVRDRIEREPYPEVEYPSRRAYIFAQRPALTNTASEEPCTEK